MSTVPRMVIAIALLLGGARGLLANDPVRVQFTTRDGVVVVGDYWTPLDMTRKAPVAILLHMYNSTRQAFEPLVPALEQAGFAILAIDLRGHGESTQPEDRQLGKLVRDRDSTVFRSMHRDVAAAYNWLQLRPEVDLSRIGLVGASVGASVALDYCMRDRSVDTAVLMTPGTNYLGINTASHIEKYRNRPLLILSSEEERSNGADYLASKTPAAEVRFFPQTDIHGTRMFGKVKGVEKTIAEFLKTHVGAPPAEMVYASINSKVFHQPGSPTIKRIKKRNLRVFSSAAEAQQRGLRPAKR